MKTFFRVVVLASVLLLLATSIDAQSPTGYLIGYVRSGDSPLQGATVKISSPALQGERTAVTDVNGYYIFALLPPGEYAIRVEQPGMQTVSAKTQVLLTATSRFDAKLTASSDTEAVIVESAPEPAIQSAQVSMNIPSGLANTVIGPTDMVGAAALAPGVTNPLPRISGGGVGENLILVNGTPVQYLTGAVLPLFVEDAIQETSVLTSAISAEYGRFTGGVISAITRSGGSEFSGTLRDSLANAKWAANRPGENITVDKINSFYGATLGGYLLPHRLWFFGAGRSQINNKDLQTFRTNIPFAQESTDRRYEAKVTAAVTPSQNLMASYLGVESGTDVSFLPGYPIYDLSVIGGDQTTRRTLVSGTYNAVLRETFVLEAHYAAQETKFRGWGGKKTSDLAAGSWGIDNQTGAFFNAPVMCRDCGTSTDGFESGELKGNWFFAAPRAGSHSVVVGATTWSEHIARDLHQSGTDFGVIATAVARPAGSTVPYVSSSGLVYPRILPGRAYIGWWPIFEQARNNDLSTNSLYVNDSWRFSSHLSFNLGLRFDQQHAEKWDGEVMVDDRVLSPRLSVAYDPLANGLHRISAAYSRYVNRLADGVEWQSAGIPPDIYLIYRGPSINPPGTPVGQLLDSRQAFAQAFTWLFSAAGGTTQEDLMKYLLTPGAAFGTFPGYTNVYDNLRAKWVDEYSLGYGVQLGSSMFLKADYVDRKWGNFTGWFLLNGGPQETDPLGVIRDLYVLRNSNLGERTYKGLQLQANWRPRRFAAGMTCTFDRTTSSNHSLEYPEFSDYPQMSPRQRESGQRGRAWVSYDVPVPSHVGALNFSILENYDSGAYYSAVGYLDPRVYAAAELGNYQYSYSALGWVPYFFSRPDKYRLDPVTSTDISVNYSRRIAATVDGFIQASLSNAFNEQKVVNVISNVYTNLDDPSIASFDPRKDTPVEGVHWVKDENFGKPTGPSSYQPARTYNVSFGLRF